MAIVDEFNHTIGELILKGFLLLLDIAIFSLVVMYLWNYLAPILGLVNINYKTSIAVFLLSRFLLKDHLLSPEPTVIHCHHEEKESEVNDEDKQLVAINCALCGWSILSTDNFCENCGAKNKQ